MFDPNRGRPMNDESAAIDWADLAAGAAALRAFERLADAWQLTLHEKLTLLGVNRATWYQWQQGRAVTLEEPVRLRLSYLFGIYSALQALLSLKEITANLKE